MEHDVSFRRGDESRRNRTQPKLVIISSPRNSPFHSRALTAIRISFDVTVISVMSIIPMLHVFVFPSVTGVVITRHRQNKYLPVYARRWRRALGVAVAVAVEGRGGGKGEGVAVAAAGGANSVPGGQIGVIGGVSLAGVVEEEVGVAHLAAEVVTLVATDGAVVSALLELDFMSCPPFLSNITRLFFLPPGNRGRSSSGYSGSFGGGGGSEKAATREWDDVRSVGVSRMRDDDAMSIASNATRASTNTIVSAMYCSHAAWDSASLILKTSRMQKSTAQCPWRSASMERRTRFT
jgi:hypothetical protein